MLLQSKGCYSFSLHRFPHSSRTHFKGEMPDTISTATNLSLVNIDTQPQLQSVAPPSVLTQPLISDLVQLRATNSLKLGTVITIGAAFFFSVGGLQVMGRVFRLADPPRPPKQLTMPEQIFPFSKSDKYVAFASGLSQHGKGLLPTRLICQVDHWNCYELFTTTVFLCYPAIALAIGVLSFSMNYAVHNLFLGINPCVIDEIWKVCRKLLYKSQLSTPKKRGNSIQFEVEQHQGNVMRMRDN